MKNKIKTGQKKKGKCNVDITRIETLYMRVKWKAYSEWDGNSPSN